MVKFLAGISLLLITLEGLSAQMNGINREGCGVSFFRTMIVNGTEVKETQYPWMVYLSTHHPYGKHACGGTIITKRHVLTAAHCLWLKNAHVYKVIVSYGSVDRRKGRKVEASKMLIHKGYSENRMLNDIALLEVKYPFKFRTEVTPICLQMTPVPIGDKEAVAAGWGSYYVGGPGYNFLRHTTVTIYSDEMCTLLSMGSSYSATLQCCAHKRSTGVCSGDSGGPLMIMTPFNRFQQVGISSYVRGKCGGKLPDVYTRVSGHAMWLTWATSSSADYMPLDITKA
uniref:Putative trypsin-like serine protease n=1 Tax=Rhipicephalus microplus TaxID=6941 RepID=A0A6G5A8T4_RHIMP